jgi:pyrroloquinoline quinone biosynthesis protein D
VSQAEPKQRKLVSGASVPRFAAHVTFRFDAARDKWIVLAPERLFMPDEQAVAILKLADGSRSVDAIVDALAAVYSADRGEIAGDVIDIFQDMADKGVMTL